MIQKLLVVIVLLGSIFSLDAQYNKPLYSWESMLPQQIVKEITQSDDYIYYATSWSVVRLDKETYNPRFYSKVEGLSSTGISEVVYDNTNNQLVIVYTSGMIDFLQEDNSVIAVGDFAQNPTYPEKTVNKAIVTDDGKILYGTRFGIVAQRSDNYLFDFTTNMELNVLEIAQNGATIYAATEEGIYRFDDDGVKNPGDFTNWIIQDGEVGLPAIYEANDIEFHKDMVYAVIEDEVYVFDGVEWKLFFVPDENFEILSISAEKEHLVITTRENSSNSKTVLYDGVNFSEIVGCGNSIRDAIEISNKKIAFADNWHGVRVLDAEGNCRVYALNSPYSFKAREIRIKDGNPYVGSGGINENFLFDTNKAGFYVQTDGSWKNYNGNTSSEIDEFNLLNFVVVEPHPTKDIFYAAAFPGGILEINNETGVNEVYYSKNSPLKGTNEVPDIERVSDLRFDEDENLWVTNYNADSALHVLTNEGIWYSYTFPGTRNLGMMEFDDFGHLWIQLGGSNGGVLVVNFLGTITDPNEFEIRIFNSGNSAITNNRILSLAKDLDGEMWVGTQSGPVIFECGDVFQNTNCFGSIRKVLQDSIPAPLLETEAINTIAIDGANRKWLGSPTGIYVQSADGETQVARYTESDSPLFDNNVIDLSYDAEFGEMYIATNKGVQSIRIDATGATRNFSKSNLYTFPNPVRPEYDGPIAIQGLARDANVKITDVRGRLVFETQANGGMAIWDGRDYNGKKAESGVYTVFATYTKDIDNLATETTKILIVR